MDYSKLTCKDLTAQRNEYFFKPPSLFRLESLIKDPRDETILYLLYNIFTMTIPGALLVFAYPSHCLGCLFLATNMFLFQERFMLGQHYYSHRGLFKSKSMDTVVLWVLSPFFGLPSGLYHTHHVLMHHSENNRRLMDSSSTELFQRDNPFHFFLYWLEFALMVWVDVPIYAFRTRRYRLCLGLTLVVLSYFYSLKLFYAAHPTATLWVFILPTAINSVLLMFGNWSQHIFIDPEKPRSNYGLAYNVINHPCNQRSFNDGYHVEHHLNSQRHWSELPVNFMNNLDQYAKEDAIVFEGLDFFQVGMYVFLRRYETLSKHLISFNTKRTAEEAEVFLRARLRPLSHQKAGPKTRGPKPQ
jgi:fatty acid desaturase